MDWDEYFFRHVYLAASKSKDPRTQIGAALVKNGVIISEGYNGFPRGVNDNPLDYEDRNIKLSKVCHGEHNSILNCARMGVSSLDSILYTNGTPCEKCSIAVIQAGIKEIVVHKEWEYLFLNNPNSHNWMASDKNSRQMLSEANIPIRYFSHFFNINLKLDGKIISI